MLERFVNYIKNQALVYPDIKILLAVSGGMDSVVMTDLFADSGYACAIAHCQFNLRGEESENDERFVKQLASHYGLPVYIKSFDTTRSASERGISIQMAARDLRYAWFEALCKEENYTAIATAHHLGDLAETMLMNLVRGTGISGLHGIKPRNGNIIRPMLFATREEINVYARSNNLSWREDSSNADTKYKRNEIRHKVVPVLKKQNPNLETRMALSSEKVAGAEAIMQRFIDEFTSNYVRKEGESFHIGLQALLDSPASVLMLYELTKACNFTYEQARDIIGTIDSTSGRYVEADGYRMYRDRETITVLPEQKDTDTEGIIQDRNDTLKAADYLWETSTLPAGEVEISGDRQVAMLDKAKLTFPLKIRTWRQGDRFFPLGMKRQKKLSDFMIDEKIPLYLKNRVRVVCSGEDIVWIAGYRIDNRYRITEHTTDVFRIGILENYDQSI
ncbi:MAG: tRNA lysidine(34) synthetase TilS [Cyclobacteriaceae bacterium]